MMVPVILKTGLNPPVLPVPVKQQYQKDSCIRYKAFDGYWAPKDRYAGLRHRRFRALREIAEERRQVMPPEPGRYRPHEAG